MKKIKSLIRETKGIYLGFKENYKSTPMTENSRRGNGVGKKFKVKVRVGKTLKSRCPEY